jgi:hypothetical protein
LLPYLMQVGRSGRFLDSRISTPGVLNPSPPPPGCQTPSRVPALRTCL